MKTDLAPLFLLLSLVAAAPAQAQSALPPQRHAELNRATQTYQREAPPAEQSAASVKLAEQCEVVVGISGYCSCLARKLPAGLVFGQYITVLSRTKAENNYSALPPAAQRTYDAVPAIRDECAASFRGAP